jgi:DNA-binding Lrp family transcriptional regulator
LWSRPLPAARAPLPRIIVTLLTMLNGYNHRGEYCALCPVCVTQAVLTLRIMQALDGTDTRLLSALARDPRRTVVALAQKLGLSRNTVQARMAQLEKKHVFLSFERRINPASLGYPLMAFISVHVQQQKLGQLAHDLAGIPEILEGYGLTGSADLLLRVVALDAEDLFRINGKILACDGVDRTDTALAMGELIPFRIQPLLERGSGDA